MDIIKRGEMNSIKRCMGDGLIHFYVNYRDC